MDHSGGCRLSACGLFDFLCIDGNFAGGVEGDSTSARVGERSKETNGVGVSISLLH